MTAEKRAFILGMVVAFSECVAGGCKRLALSPPLYGDDFAEVRDEAYGIIEKHGLLHYHEANADAPEDGRWEWICIAARQATFDEYLRLRAAGYSPLKSLKPFSDVLSYNAAESVNTGYDAFREYFPPEAGR